MAVPGKPALLSAGRSLFRAIRTPIKSLIAMLPVIVLGIVAQKHIVKGLTAGAVKGSGRR